MILGTQYLDSGVYTLSLEKSFDLDITSFVYSKYGTFRIVPILYDYESYESLIRYDVFLDDGFIGCASIPDENDTGDFNTLVAQTMATAINIVTVKLNELIDKEEMEMLTRLISVLFDGVAMTEEQKAMYRTFIVENGMLNDIIEEMKTPTDILGEND